MLFLRLFPVAVLVPLLPDVDAVILVIQLHLPSSLLLHRLNLRLKLFLRLTHSITEPTLSLSAFRTLQLS